MDFVPVLLIHMWIESIHEYILSRWYNPQVLGDRINREEVGEGKR